MEKKELVKYFKLEKHQELFEKALFSKACGGGDEFKFMALKGDYILKTCLLDILSTKYNTRNTGALTQLSMQFHNKRTLKNLSEHLGIPKLMKTFDKNSKIETNDKKEVIEALLAAVNQVNKLEVCKEIVQKLYKKARELGILDVDAISILQNFCRQNKIDDPEYSFIEFIGKESKKTIFQCELSVSLGREITIRSDKFNKKQDAKLDAAIKTCKKLKVPMEEILQQITQSTNEEIFLSVKQSIKKEILEFRKNGAFEATMKLGKNTKQPLIDYVKEKYHQEPFEMLIKVNARLGEDVRGNIWSTRLEMELGMKNQELIILHMDLLGENYFEIASADSKRKAKRAVAEKFVNNSMFFTWIKKNYPDYKI